MKSTAAVTPSSGEETPLSPSNDVGQVAQLQLEPEQLRATSEGVRLVLERQAQTVENKLIDTEVGNNAKTKKEEAAAVAEEMYSLHSNIFEENLRRVNALMGGNVEFFDPIVAICPFFNILMTASGQRLG